MIDVLCCCKPENVMGQMTLRDGMAAGLRTRTAVDPINSCQEEAFSSDERSLEELLEMPGFVENKEKHRKGGRTWKK